MSVLSTIRDQDHSVKARVDFLSYHMANGGSDETKAALTAMIERNDKLGEAAEMLEGMAVGPLRTEYLLSKHGLHATITNGDRTLHAPCVPKALEEVEIGEPVLFAVKAGCVIGPDPHAISAGRVCTVVRCINEGQQVVIEQHGQEVVYHLIEELRGKLAAGDKIVTDEGARTVIQLLEKTHNADSLLTPLTDLDCIDLSTIADINPATEDILFRCRAYTDHADWMDLLRVRPSCSYLFCGPTGTGKTTALNIVARKLADHVEHLTGKRISRLVRADTSTFFTSYFGETEQRIKTWFAGLKQLGSEKLMDANGKEVKVPILVVLEEGEALFRARGEESASSHLFDRPLSLMLSEASSVGAEMDTPIIIVMTSNRPSLIDAAALRRFGMRRVYFTGLSPEQGQQVIEKRLHKKTPVKEASREEHVNMVIEYLFGDVPDQRLCEVKFGDGSVRYVERKQLVTPAIIEEAMSLATDACLRKSVQVGEMIGLDAEDVVMYMDQHFSGMAAGLKCRNLEDYVPQWFAEAGCHATGVKCLVHA